jgi:hypothetical protein
MPNEKIKLEININQNGAQGALRETHKLEKSYNSIAQRLDKIANAQGKSFGEETREESRS